uniref:Uncharacterized protein n=1 Tax=Vitrella brassicaformis TaxID=1169539 RepID=A0A7S1P6Q6_9ALVE|mmetsp:Transcript_3742/g.8544  ORF Transcript_3742/g.8544 Transcript_3742/m.8544 type:complete len:103 (+) Transcript_3742:237-545(+)
MQMRAVCAVQVRYHPNSINKRVEKERKHQPGKEKALETPWMDCTCAAYTHTHTHTHTSTRACNAHTDDEPAQWMHFTCPGQPDGCTHTSTLTLSLCLGLSSG